MRYRRVWHVVVGYTVIAIGFLELADLTLEAFDGPDYILGWLFLAVLSGFPIAVALAWVFDFTTDGIKRTAPQPSSPVSQSPTTLIVLVVASAVVSGATGWFLAGRSAGTSLVQSLVVLPLANLTGIAGQDYFVDGIHDALISELARLSAIDVVSRTSAMQYRDSRKSLREIGNELDVEAVLEGSVLRSGDQITVNAKLLDVERERNLWSGQYQRATSEIGALQSEVVLNIAREIQLSLSPDEENRLKNTKSVNPQALDSLLQGRARWRNQSAEDIEQSINLFNTALTYEPNFAEAYASLAQAYISLTWVTSDPLMPSQVLPQAKAAAQRALAIDPDSPDAHMAIGLVAWRFEFDKALAEQSFARAIELSPSHAEALHWYALFLATSGDNDNAQARINRALELDPLSLLITANRGWIYYFGGDFEQALANATAANKLWPDSGIPHYHEGLSLLALDRPGEAVMAFQRSIELSGRLPYLLSALGVASARAGSIDEAEQVLTELNELDYTSPYLLAALESALGRTDEALVHLATAVEARDSYLAFLAVDPIFAELRNEQEFVEILDQVGHTTR